MIERLLAPDSIEVPRCRCGVDMAFKSLTARSADVGVKVLECPSCSSEMQLMIWLPEQTEG
jgi:hypothetical protein